MEHWKKRVIASIRKEELVQSRYVSNPMEQQAEVPENSEQNQGVEAQ